MSFFGLPGLREQKQPDRPSANCHPLALRGNAHLGVYLNLYGISHPYINGYAVEYSFGHGHEFPHGDPDGFDYGDSYVAAYAHRYAFANGYPDGFDDGCAVPHRYAFVNLLAHGHSDFDPLQHGQTKGSGLHITL